MTTKTSLIAALGKDRVIGKDNQLLWHIPDDLKRFKELTVGHPCIMGRKTFESIIATLGHTLPDRTTIVLSRNTSFVYDGVITVPNMEVALDTARATGTDEIFVCGGEQIYAQTLFDADKLYLTLIDDEQEGDAHFPLYEHEFTKKVFEEHREYHGLKYTWVDLER
jgi:dihydrofolate reductase